MDEHHALERKSLRQVIGRAADWDGVARTCVCFANARGGDLLIGVEDGEDEPPSAQRIPAGLAEQARRRVAELTLNVSLVHPTVETASSGGERLRVRVLPSSGVACTTDGRYFMRVSDTCRPVAPEDLQRLFEEKTSYVWESTLTAVSAADADPAHVARLLDGLRASDRVKPQVKARPDDEILAGYDLTREGRLTNLGVLWLGRREDRARLGHAPIVTYLRYDRLDRKVDKEIFGDDYALTPWDQLAAVEALPVWQESVEVSRGLFRDRVPNYDVEIIRELVANALVHRVYTVRGDVFVNLYTDRLEVHSPGSLPIGVTPLNILQARVRRNERLARLFHDLKLMEGEGTGYDRVYALLLSSGKPVPLVREAFDRVEVTVRGLDLDRRALLAVAEAARVGDLPERERITLGLLAREGPMSKSDLARLLSLTEASRADSWLGTLPERSLVVRSGRGPGTRYSVNPALLKRAGTKTRTSLAEIETHRLLELLRTDLDRFPSSQIGEIRGRIGPEISRRRIQRALQTLRDSGVVVMTGERGTARYACADGSRSDVGARLHAPSGATRS